MNGSATPSIVVVGAGLSGLACARALVENGHGVKVFDKARGVGGRMSTRRADDLRYDHGAQYFTARAPEFADAVKAWVAEGVVAAWPGTITTLENRATLGDDGERKGRPVERFVGVPGMSAICKHLAADLDIGLATRVAPFAREGDQWRLRSEAGDDLGVHDVVVVSAPPAQTAALLASAAPTWSARVADTPMAPCWAVMVSFEERLPVPFDGAFVHGSPLSWVARNGSKPGRPDQESWVLHGSPSWSSEHVEDAPEQAARQLLDAFWRALAPAGVAARTAAHCVAHRWRYALPTAPVPEVCLADAALGLVLCGDWCGGPRVEGAFLSGRAAAARVLELVSRESTGSPTAGLGPPTQG